MDLTNIILEFIKTIFSWPIIIFILVIIFLTRYHDSISSFIKNIKSAKGPGFEITQKQKNGSKKEIFSEKENINKLTKELDQINASNIEKEKMLEEAKILIPNLFNGLQYYKFEYLDLFFIASTKAVLGWFSANIQTTREFYKSVWLPIIKNELQLEIILSVLLAQSMLQDLGNSIKITDEGNQFLKYIYEKYKEK